VLANGASEARLWRPHLAALADEFTLVAWGRARSGPLLIVPQGRSPRSMGDPAASAAKALIFLD